LGARTGSRERLRIDSHASFLQGNVLSIEARRALATLLSPQHLIQRIAWAPSNHLQRPPQVQRAIRTLFELREVRETVLYAIPHEIMALIANWVCVLAVA